MAEVFAGNALGSHGFQKPVAIKRLLPELANDDVFVERLISEAKLLVGMAHGNIVSVLDLARDGDDVFLVMEFVDGPSLRQLMKARGDRGMPLGTSTYIVQAAAAGLEFAHGRPGGAVIHADISPSNVLLTTSGEVRVADFGIARREGGGVGVVEGKWAYMAPEQARGEALTPRSDVFALGVVFYELLCGEHPLGRQVTAGERELEPKRIIPPRVVRQSIPANLDAICMKALSYEPHDRYSRMQHFIDAIVDARFSNQYREGANDLAKLIREITPGANPAKEQTQHTNRPVTIVTRSLISQLNLRPSSPSVEVDDDDSADTGDLVPKIADSAAQTRALALEDVPIELRVRADATPSRASRPSMPSAMAIGTALPAAPAVVVLPQAFQVAPGMLPAPELASIHGGTFTGSAQVDIAVAPRNYKWAIGVLGLAAIVGAIAAVVSQLGGSEETGKPFEILPYFDVANFQPPPAPKPAPPKPKPPEPTIVATVPQPTVPDPTPIVKPEDVVAAPKPGEVRPHRNEQGRVATAPTPARKAPDGWLRIDAESGAGVDVIVGNQIKETPCVIRLAPGTYPVRFKDEHHAFNCKLDVESNKMNVVKVSMEDRVCEVD
jgi:serine/threonine protein kinase